MISGLLKYRKITILFFVMAVFVGVFSFMSLNQRENPEIAVSVAVVQTIYPGASPEKVEQLVTKPLEEKINEMDNILSLTSTSAANVSIITVELKPGSNNKQSWDTLRQKVQAAEAELPVEAYKPEVNDNLAQIAAQIVHLVVDTPEQVESLRSISENWKNRLRSIEGVAGVEIIGMPEQEVRVTVDMAKLEAYQLHWGMIAQALTQSHDRTPIGMINQDQRSLYLNLSGEWKSAEDIAETVVFRSPLTGGSVKLKDVADVRLASEKLEQRVHVNGKPAVDISINAESGVDVPSLQERIDERIDALVKDLPEYVKLESMFSQRDSVEKLFSELGHELLIGMLAVIVITSLGLTLGTSLIVALAIPISIAIGFIPVGAFGIDLNQITIMSLVIVLGILVDDAIVVNDNIERRQQLGDSPEIAALEGSRDVAISITTATVATAAAFFPLFFLKGNIGDFIRPIPIIISLTLFASMAMSLTIIPIFRRWIGERRLKLAKSIQSSSEHPGFLGHALHRLSEFYESQIHRFLRKPMLTGLTALIVGTSSFGLLPFLGVQYFPNAERAEFIVDVKLPVGSTFAATDDTMQSIAAWVAKQEGVLSVSAYAGRTAPKFYYTEIASSGARLGQLFVTIDTDQLHTSELVKPWRQQLQSMYPELDILPRELEQGPPVGAPIAVRISGPDLNELRRISGDIKDMLGDIPGAVNISDDIGEDMETVDLVLDRDKANRFGVTEKDLSSTLRLATEGIAVSQLQWDEQLLDVKLYSAEEGATMNKALAGLTIPSQTGALYSLEEFVHLEPNQMIQSIHHRNMNRTVTVRSYTEDRLPDEILSELQLKMASLVKPAEYSIEFGGENAERNDAFLAIGKLSIIVLLLIYIIIAMQFYSLSIPILVLSTVYLAFAGALIGLFVTGAPIGFMALMGAVSLSGIVVRNGIVLVEFIEQARERGLGLHEAIAQAGRARLRPILLTTATAVFGLSPMAIMGGNLWRPMAVTIIFGLIYSTILTLVVVPSLYVKLAEWRESRATPSLNTGHHQGKSFEA
jgi:multidrug efflux pump subunit AcrB